MSSILKILRRIGGTKVTPTAGEEGQLAVWKAGKAPADAVSLYFHDGAQWVELIDTKGKALSQPVFVGETAPASPTSGEFWLKGSTKELSVWDGAQWAVVALRNEHNNFSQSQVISVTDTLPALTVRQLGAGPALKVEDDAAPDATPFIIDQYGLMGVGTAAPQAKLHVDIGAAGSLVARFEAKTDPYISLWTSGVQRGYLQSTPTITTLASDQNLDFMSGGKHIMRFDTSQCMLFNVLSNVVGGSGHEFAFQYTGGGTRYGMGFYPKKDNTTAITFANASNTTVGAIVNTATATAYNTSSDYRLKKDIQPVSNPVARLNALKPVNFAWKSNGERVDGFIAHEVQAIIPEAVSGEKDAVNDEGNPMYQGIDQSKLVPLLVAALQDALKRIEALEARP